jgi:hypothetical protein
MIENTMGKEALTTSTSLTSVLPRPIEADCGCKIDGKTYDLCFRADDTLPGERFDCSWIVYLVKWNMLDINLKRYFNKV